MLMAVYAKPPAWSFFNSRRIRSGSHSTPGFYLIVPGLFKRKKAAVGYEVPNPPRGKIAYDERQRWLRGQGLVEDRPSGMQ
jgi:hypothetical protein